MPTLSLLSLLEAPLTTQWRLRELRNEPGVRRHMYTDHVIGEEEHSAWLQSLAGDRRQEFFAVIYQGNVAGGASLSKIDRRNLRCDWAFYVGDAFQGKGLGPIIEFSMIEKAFNDFSMKKLNCEVLITNQSVIKLHKKFGFVEEGIRRQEVLKDGERIDVSLLGLLSEEWLTRKPAMAKVCERLG